MHENTKSLYKTIGIFHCIRVDFGPDFGHVFGVKINLYLKISYTCEIFSQPALKL